MLPHKKPTSDTNGMSDPGHYYVTAQQSMVNQYREIPIYDRNLMWKLWVKNNLYHLISFEKDIPKLTSEHYKYLNFFA